MDLKIRQAQYKILKIFAKEAKDLALAGGTALELYYLHHRFSADLDFFSPRYDVKEIDALISAFNKSAEGRIKLESEFIAAGKAKVRFYIVPVKDSERPLKIDFIEDVIFNNPKIVKFGGLPVYSVENIYLQKMIAVTGTNLEEDDIGRQVNTGRRESRDIFDIYMLSKKICALHKFIKGQPAQVQRGMIHWYRTFSRQDLKLALLDLDIYDKEFNAREMIIYLEKEVKKFVREVLDADI
jgi:predicted nucleotidyltransferase component of viral defense system